MKKILEVRPGEGGEDASMFAKELFEALTLYARRNNLLLGILKTDTRSFYAELETDKTIESLVGTHRIQRIPGTDKKGRRHTSSVSVALVDEISQEKTEIDENELRVDFFRGTGPGGQHRNKTSTAVRLTHQPSGIVITRTSGRSQSANLESAKAELEEKLKVLAGARNHEELNQARVSQLKNEHNAKTFTHNQQRGESLSHNDGRRWRMSEFMKGKM